MKNPTEKGKHLTQDKRLEIELGLNSGMTFKAIVKRIGKDPTTALYEVKHHRMEHKNGFSTSDEPCPILLKPPFVCNGCSKKSNAGCRHIRYVYRAAKAQDE